MSGLARPSACGQNIYIYCGNMIGQARPVAAIRQTFTPQKASQARRRHVYVSLSLYIYICVHTCMYVCV